MHGQPRDRGNPLVGNEHDPGAALFGGRGEFQHAGVIAADIEDHHHVALADIEHVLRPVRRGRRDQRDFGPGHLQMRGEIGCERVADAPAAQMNPAPAVGEKRHHGIEGPVVEQLQRSRQVLHCGDGEAVEDMSIGRIGRPSVMLGDRILQLRREFGAEFLLERRKSGEAELLRQPEDAWRRHAGLAGELGDADQSGHRIVGKERRHELALGGREAGGFQAQSLGDGGPLLGAHGCFSLVRRNVTNLTPAIQSEIIATIPIASL